MTTSKNNRKKKSKPDANIFFPDELRGKKLRKDYWPNEIKECLEKYLTTENPDYLIKAIKADVNGILQSHGVPAADLRYSTDIKFVDAWTVAWRSIELWQWLYITEHPEGKIVLDADDWLRKIGSAFIPRRRGYWELDCRDFLLHKKVFGQGKKFKYAYRNPDDFVKVWEFVKGEFEKCKSKDKIKGYKKAINNLNTLFPQTHFFNKYFINVSERDAERIDDRKIGYTVSSYLKINHVNNCKYCIDKRNLLDKENLYVNFLDPHTIYELYIEAQKEVKTQ